MAACLLALTIQLLEEALEIGHENVLAPQYFPLGEQLRKADVADHVIAVLAPILLGDAVEVEDFQYVGFRVSHINFQLHVGRVLRTVEVVLFLVFVPVVVLTGHDVAQDRRGGRQAAGALAEHELAVVAFAPDHHAVVFVIDAVDVFAGGDEFGLTNIVNFRSLSLTTWATSLILTPFSRAYRMSESWIVEMP